MSANRKPSLFAQKMQKLRDIKENKNQTFHPARSSAQHSAFGENMDITARLTFIITVAILICFITFNQVLVVSLSKGKKPKISTTKI